jgi:hypothetical protein
MDELEEILDQINQLSGVALDAVRQAKGGGASGGGASQEGAPPAPEEGAPVPPGQ